MVKADPGELALTMAGSQVERSPSRDAQEVAQLLKQAKAGDAAAFEQIILQHERLVLRTALRLLGEIKDAQDAAQEVFLRLYKYLSRFDQTGQFAPWLYRMTVNVSRDFRRRRQKSAALSLDELSASSELERLTSSQDLDATLIQAEERRALRQGLKAVSPREREVLVLRGIEGLSTREVARSLGVSQATVRSYLSTARVKLKEFMERVFRKKR